MRLALALLLFLVPVMAQTAQQSLAVDQTHECDRRHVSVVERAQAIRLVYPSVTKVTYFDGKKLVFTSQDAFMTITKELDVSSTSQIPPDYAKNYKKKKVWIYYCEEHLMLYGIFYPAK